MQPQTPSPTPEVNSPAAENLPSPITPESSPAVEKSAEQAPVSPETTQKPAGDSANQNFAEPAQPTVQPIPVTVPADEPITDDSSLPVTAEDNDLIEKEWVKKAVDVVNETREDPRRQTVEIGRVKAGYVKKRFNKNLPLKSTEA